MPSAQQTTSNENLQHPTKDGSLPRNSTAGTSSTVTGSKTPQEYPEFIKQALLTVEKKSRNLEKRRAKLDEYKELQKKGNQLNEDQLNAVSKYDEVKICLELVKDLDKQLIALANDALKAQKKQTKKEQLEREELVKEKLKEVQKFQALLNTFGDEKTRQDFLDGKFGITAITKEELDLLDEFDKLVSNKQLSKTYENDVNEVTDHYLHLIDGKNKPVLNTTYSELKKIFEKILLSNYWSDDLNKNEQQQEQQQDQQQETLKDEHEQKVLTANVNTSTDDYVMVSRHEVEITQIENNQDENSLKVQQTTIVQQETQIGPDQILVEQHTDQNTFFTTLNRPDNLIKEFLNENNDGINFLQDSQIYPQQQQQQVHEQHQTQQQSDFSSNNTFNTQKSGEYENENPNPNNQYGFGKRNDNGFNPRNNGGSYQRRPFNPDNNERRGGGGRGGSYSGGRGGGRGGFNRGGGSGNSNTGRGGFRGKPRNPGQQFNKNNQIGHQNKSEVHE